MDSPITRSRERATITEHTVEDTAYTKYPGNYHGYSDHWDAESFKKTCQVRIEDYHKGRDLEIDLIGISPAIANAYRRIILAEVPTIAIEHCFIENNTSVIQDELLASRLGMIPIKVDPTLFKWKPRNLAPANTGRDHTIVFTLKAKCEKKNKVDPEKTGLRSDLYEDYKVYSGKLKWEPLKDQSEKFLRGSSVEPVHKNILIAKLREKQELDIRLHAVKGIGRDHAKFSPVATVTYRLMPDIRLKEKITGEAARRLRDSFSKGVVEIAKSEAKIINPRIDSGSRNHFRHADLADKVHYDLIKDHFIFKIESAGAIPAIDILLQANMILDLKCQYFLKEVREARSKMNGSAPMDESW